MLRIDPFGGWPELQPRKQADQGETEEEREKRWKEEEEAIDRKLEKDALGLDDEQTTTKSTMPQAQDKSHASRARIMPPGFKAASRSALQQPHTALKHTSILDAKSAANALSNKPLPRFAQPTTSTTARKNAETSIKQPAGASPRIGGPAQKTLGYATGRKVSSTLRTKDLHNKSGKDAEAAGAGAGAVMEDQMPSWLSVYDADDGDDNLFGDANDSMFESDLWMKTMEDPDFELKLEDVL